MTTRNIVSSKGQSTVPITPGFIVILFDLDLKGWLSCHFCK